MTDNNPDTSPIGPADRHQAASTALELIELARHTQATGVVDNAIVTATKPREMTLGLLCVLTCAFNAAGDGDFELGLARTRELVKGVMTMQAERDSDE